MEDGGGGGSVGGAERTKKKKSGACLKLTVPFRHEPRSRKGNLPEMIVGDLVVVLHLDEGEDATAEADTAGGDAATQ